jgi:hypothetical protein
LCLMGECKAVAPSVLLSNSVVSIWDSADFDLLCLANNFDIIVKYDVERRWDERWLGAASIQLSTVHLTVFLRHILQLCRSYLQGIKDQNQRNLKLKRQNLIIKLMGPLPYIPPSNTNLPKLKKIMKSYKESWNEQYLEVKL